MTCAIFAGAEKGLYLIINWNFFILHNQDWPYCDYSENVPHCDDIRCPLGNCLQAHQVCDGRFDCHDGSDENPQMCQQRLHCATDEMRCGTGQCVSKTKFCDGINDCADGSDEPQHCSCVEYLR